MVDGSPGELSPRRVTALAAGLVALGAAFELVARRSVAGALCLTVAGAVSIINFRWLEGLVRRVVQPGRPRFDRRAVLTAAARFVLAGGAAALLLVPGVDFVAVALGVSALVVAVVVEGWRWGREGKG